MKRTLWEMDSRQARVVCELHDRRIVVVKHTVPHLPPDPDRARWLNAVSRVFRDGLRELSVPLAEPYEFAEEDGRAVQVSPYVGPDLEHVDVSQKVMNRLIRAIHGVLLQAELRVGLDARLSNFCLGPDEYPIYVDTFPPLALYKGEWVLHYPNPTEDEVIRQEIARKVQPLGVLRRLRFSILETQVPEGEQKLFQALAQEVNQEFAAQAAAFFAALPSSNGNIREAIASLESDDVDGAREVALRLAPLGGEARAEFLHEAFGLSSHFYPQTLPTEERMRRLRQLLNSQL